MKHLKVIKKKHSGRGAGGQVVVRHQGGQQKDMSGLLILREIKEILEEKLSLLNTIQTGPVILRLSNMMTARSVMF